MGNGVFEAQSEKMNRERSTDFGTICRMEARTFLAPMEELIPNTSVSIIMK